jgi:hypothetical protein
MLEQARVAARTCLTLFAFGCGGVIDPSSGSADASASADASTPIDGGPVDATLSDASDDVAADAGPDRTPTCGPINCHGGCCRDGQCLSGSEDTRCGFGGQLCVDCTTFGWFCGTFDVGMPHADACIPPGATPFGPPCNWASCLRCCQGDVCVDGNTSEACGSHGQPCVACTGALERCDILGNTGQCVGFGPCNPTNCSGCCDASGACVDSVALGLCGTGGVACQKCALDQVCRYGQCE